MIRTIVNVVMVGIILLTSWAALFASGTGSQGVTKPKKILTLSADSI